jgi:hypothetical protein
MLAPAPTPPSACVVSDASIEASATAFAGEIRDWFTDALGAKRDDTELSVHFVNQDVNGSSASGRTDDCTKTDCAAGRVLERNLGGISPHFGSFLVDSMTDSRADAEQGALIKRAELFSFGPVQDGVSALDRTCGDRSVAVAGGGGAGFQVFCGDELILTAGGGGGGGIKAQSSTKGPFSFSYEGGGGGGAQWNISGSNVTQNAGGGCGGNSTTQWCTPDADFEDASPLSVTQQVSKRMRS